MNILLTILFYQMMTSSIIFDFKSNSGHDGWKIINDDAMGGKSNGQMSMNTDGHGVFSGYVSTENNGGFSSVRYAPLGLHVKKFDRFKLRVKGDGKSYQSRA